MAERRRSHRGLCVAGVVIFVSWRLARRTIDALLDAAPLGVRAGIIHAVTSVEGVVEVDRVRIRKAGDRYFVDLSVALPRVVTFQRSEQIVSAVTTRRPEPSPQRRRHGPLASQAASRRKHLRPHPRRRHAPQRQRARRQRARSRRQTARRAAPRTQRELSNSRSS